MMKNRIILRIIQIFLIILFVGSSNTSLQTTNEKNYPPRDSNFHPKIEIAGNMQLDAFPNKTGSGMLVDPYIIKDLTIDIAGGLYSAIKIIDTDRYLILQNLTINGSRGYWSTQDGGIRLLRCNNVNITQCLFTNNRFSTMLSIVENCYIYNNTSYDNYSGLYTTDSNEGEVYFFNNTCYQNFEGIHADGGKFIKIYNNSLWDNDYGIYIQFGEYFEVYNNNISFCEKGIYLKSNGGNHNYKNSISSCSIGIELNESFVNIIRNNSIKYNDVGVRYNFSSYNVLISNNLDNVINIEEFNSELNNQNCQFFPKISIIGDIELDTFPNKTGSGTHYDPYVIENLIIDSQKNGSPIEIHSTSRYLVLRNLIVTGAPCINENNDGGIELIQCSNVNITQCIFIRNEFGTHLLEVTDCHIFNNTAAYNFQHGIYCGYSNHVHIFGNSLHDGCNGIHTDGDSNFDIYNNHIYDNRIGMRLPRVNFFNVYGNNITSNSEIGIYLYESNSSNINENLIKLCDYGIKNENGNFNHYSNNLITDCVLSGIYLENSDYNKFEKNLIQNCPFGVFLNSSNRNTFIQNQMINNGFDYEQYNSQYNQIIEFRDWKKIGLWITFGVIGLAMGLFASIYFPIRSKNAPKRYLQKGIQHKESARFNKALECFNFVLKKEPQNEIAWNQKLSVLYSLERYTEVLICLDQALKVNPNFIISQSMQEKIDQIRIRDYIDDAIKRIEE